jgi:hypothetical protein
MEHFRQETGALRRRLPGGSRLAITERWPKQLLTPTPVDPLAADAEAEDDAHDGWQAVRMRRRPLPRIETPTRNVRRLA